MPFMTRSTATPNRYSSARRLLIALLIGTFFGLGLSACSRPVTDETLKKSADAFWQSQVAGNWHQSWTYFSPRALERLQAQQPELFKNVDAYASQRARWALTHPYKEFRFLNVSADPKTRTGAVTLEILIRGQNTPRQITQRWIYDPERKWLIDSAPTPGK
jgi:hypothetical protein